MSFLKNLVKSTFNYFGLDIRTKEKNEKKGRRTRLDEVLEHIILLGFKPNTVIDVGVGNGTFELYERFQDAKHLLIEPLKEFENVLKSISLQYNADYVLAAAGPRSSTTIINVHPFHLEGSSIFKESDGSYVDGTPREIPVVAIDDLCSEKGLRGPYIIKVDAQGAELTVLEGAMKVLEDTELIILEVQLFKFFQNNPQFYDIVVYMKNHGFVAYDIFGGYNRPLDNALASIDMVYVKENGRFRKEHFFASQKQREDKINIFANKPN